jgi:ribose transport system substrate-binding protein
MRKKVAPGALTIALLMLVSAPAFGGGQGETGVPITLEVSIPAPAQSHPSPFADGADTYAKLMGLSADVMAFQPASGKQLADIKAAIARTGGYAVFFVVFSSSPEAVSIARTLEQAGVYWVSGGPKPPDLKAWDFPHWVAHIGYDGFAAGSFTAAQLITTFKTPGQGKIIALQGRLDDPSNAERWQGLQKVLTDNPGIQLVQWDSAQGDRTKAHDSVRAMLAAHPDVDGVWAEDDEMAMGAIQALKEAGLAAAVKVTGCGGDPEMLDAVSEGLAAATVVNDQRYQAELSLAMSLATKQGRLDVVSLPHKHRMFEISGLDVDSSNAGQVLRDFAGSTRWYDLTSFFARWSVALD